MKKSIKKLSMAVLIAGSMGTMSGLSTVAVAAENAGGVVAAFGETLKHIDEGIAPAAAGDQVTTLEHIMAAGQARKDISGDSWAMNTSRAGTALRIAKTRTKKGDLVGAEEKLKEAKKFMLKAKVQFDAEMS